MQADQIITKTLEYLKSHQQNQESAHDYWHVIRVWKNVQNIAKSEQVDSIVVELAALLHDIADYKFHGGDEGKGGLVAKEFLESIGVDPETISRVVSIINNMSFKGGNYQSQDATLELKVVQDADRLDALGAIGIARAFTYGGYFKRSIYDPEVQPKFNMTKEEYTTHKSTTINHFHEKLLLLKDKMNTETGKSIAKARHKIMLDFLEQFEAEWGGDM